MSDEDANDDVADADDSYNLQCGSSRSLIWLDFTISVTELGQRTTLRDSW